MVGGYPERLICQNCKRNYSSHPLLKDVSVVGVLNGILNGNPDLTQFRFRVYSLRDDDTSD